MNIFLIGYMASGKSTIGRLLASTLEFDFMDLDSYIESQEEMSISEIFSKKGEIYFRKKETEYLKEILDLKNKTIVALGGGTPCYGSNIDLLKSIKNGKTIYLKVSIEELANRLNNEKEHRPLVAHLESIKDIEEFVGKHVFERQFYYNQAELTIDITRLTIDQIVERIVLELF